MRARHLIRHASDAPCVAAFSGRREPTGNQKAGTRSVAALLAEEQVQSRQRVTDPMLRDKASYLHTAVIAAVLLGGPVIAFAQTGGAPQYPPPSVGGDAQPYPRRAQPKTAVPMEPDEGISGSSSEPLSHQLSRSGGVIHPPANVDPGITQPAPDIGPHSMPVIPPPDTPGGNTDVKPK